MNFSVLMSVYKNEKASYLEESIKSILNQTVMPSEIVLVKDGEVTDEIQKLIDTYQRTYKELFKIVDMKENKGLGIALQLGIKECKYDIIARMDTDDIAVKDRFEKQIKVLRENSDIDIVGSYINEFEGNIQNIVAIRKVPNNSQDIEEYAKNRNPFNHMTVMFRKDAVLSAGNYKHFLWNEDYYLWVRMIMNGSKGYNIPSQLVYVRAGKDMFKRRGGIRYALVDIKLQKEFKKLGFITNLQFIKNSIIRSSIRIIPNSLRGWIYINVLRG